MLVKCQLLNLQGNFLRLTEGLLRQFLLLNFSHVYNLFTVNGRKYLKKIVNEQFQYNFNDLKDGGKKCEFLKFFLFIGFCIFLAFTRFITTA